MKPEGSEERSSPSTWLLLVCAAILVSVSSLLLLYLFLRWVPTQAMLLLGLSPELPESTRSIVGLANFLGRYSVLVILGGMPFVVFFAGLVVLGAITIRGWTPAKVLAASCLAVALVEIVASSVVVFTMHEAVLKAAERTTVFNVRELLKGQEQYEREEQQETPGEYP